MFCCFCGGGQVPVGALFCPWCGKNLRKRMRSQNDNVARPLKTMNDTLTSILLSDVNYSLNDYFLGKSE